MGAGNVILLNGCSSAGKTTLAFELQNTLRQPYQHIALDQFRDAMPPSIRGLNSPLSDPGSRGLNVVPRRVRGEPVTEIHFGDFGRGVLRAMRRSVLELSKSGFGVIVDDILFEKEFLLDYADILDPTKTWLVGVKCPLEVVRSREAARSGRFPGTAEGHYFSVHEHGAEYDIEIDTSVLSPIAAAEKIVSALEVSPRSLMNFRSPQT